MFINELKSMWEELKSYRPLPHCSCDSCKVDCFEKFVTSQQKDYVFKFLNVLNKPYAIVRSQAIMMRPFPSLDEAYNLIIREESQRLNVHVSRDPEVENSALFTRASYRKQKSDMVGSYYKKPDHLKEKCYRLVGFPLTFKFKGERGSRMVNQLSSNVGVGYNDSFEKNIG